MSRVATRLGPALLLLSLVASGPQAQEIPDPLIRDAPETCESSDALFLAIDRERDLIITQRGELDRELERLELVRESVRQETERLSALREEVQGVLDQLVASEESEVRRVIAVYEGMKPEEAARLLDGLDMSITMVIFSGMSERRAAPILARMNPVRAQAISRILVEMAKLPEDRNLEGIRLR